jgi:hypothetical protein
VSEVEAQREQRRREAEERRDACGASDNDAGNGGASERGEAK